MQFHTEIKPVDKYRGNLAAFGRQTGFFFNDARQRQQLFFRCQGQILIPSGKRRRQFVLHSRFCLCQNAVAALPSGKMVSFRQHVAFLQFQRNVSAQIRIIRQNFLYLRQRFPLGYRYAADNHVAFCQTPRRLLYRNRAGKSIFSGLNFPGQPVQPRIQYKQPRIGHHALFFQQRRRPVQPRPARHGNFRHPRKFIFPPKLFIHP